MSLRVKLQYEPSTQSTPKGHSHRHQSKSEPVGNGEFLNKHPPPRLSTPADARTKAHLSGPRIEVRIGAPWTTAKVRVRVSGKAKAQSDHHPIEWPVARGTRGGCHNHPLSKELVIVRGKITHLLVLQESRDETIIWPFLHHRETGGTAGPGDWAVGWGGEG